MRTFKFVKKETREIDQVTCNGCGELIKHNETATSIHSSGAFNGKVLYDLTDYDFDLCETCIVHIMNDLKIPPKVYDRADGQIINWSDKPYNKC